MDRVELALLTLAEATTTAKHVENDTQGVEGLEKDAKVTAKGSESAYSANVRAGYDQTHYARDGGPLAL